MLGDFIIQYIAARPGMKPNTLKNYRQTERSLVDYFGLDRLLTEITPDDCDDWKAHQEAKRHAPATIGRNVKRARQFLRAAVRKKLIAENPMQDVKAPAQVNAARMFHVSCEVTERILTNCPDAEWKLIVAMARFGGVRTPSETFALMWADVNWAENRIRIPSPKTACHAWRESRTIPFYSLNYGHTWNRFSRKLNRGLSMLSPSIELSVRIREPNCSGYVIGQAPSCGSVLSRICGRPERRN